MSPKERQEREHDRYNFPPETERNLIMFAAGGDPKKVREIKEILKKDEFYWEVVLITPATTLTSVSPDFSGTSRSDWIDPSDPDVEKGILIRAGGNPEKIGFYREIAAKHNLFRKFYKHSETAPEGFYPPQEV